MEETVSMYSDVKERLRRLDFELSLRDKVLSDLIHEKTLLLESMQKDCEDEETLEPPTPTSGISEHLRYTLPLVELVSHLQLQRKEEVETLRERELKSRCDEMGQRLWVATLKEHQCVLKGWARELEGFSETDIRHMEEKVSNDFCVSNISYRTEYNNETLTEYLGFTVLCRGVHLRALIKSAMPCPSIHVITPTKTMLGISTDTFVPGLEEQVKRSMTENEPVNGVVLWMAQHIKDEMAPFAIIVPKRKAKGKVSRLQKAKSPKRD